MAEIARTVVVCSCDETMPLDTNAIGRACGGTVKRGDQMCRRELDVMRMLMDSGAPLTIACTQEEPLFRETAADLGRSDDIVFANIREHAGWSDEAERSGPKMAALLAAAAEPMPATPLVTMESEGVTLLLGRDAAALEAAARLADRLDLTVVLTHPEDVAPPRVTDYPILRGRVRNASGWLGAFEVTLDGVAQPLPSSRDALRFGPAKDGAVSRCDIIIDLTGGQPLFPAHDLRAGYLRADPRDPAAVQRAIFDAANLVGTFDKPRYISFTESLCAHSRSKITGCTRCLDLCPPGAIVPAGDHVAIDANICAGCGACAAACPTGAAAYALPPSDAGLRRLRTMLAAYREAGGASPVVLVHDVDHGDPLIDALARFGRGLPAHVLPLRVNEVSQVGPEWIAAAFAYGATGLRLLGRAKPKHETTGILATLDISSRLLSALGYGEGVATLVETDDPDALRVALDAAPRGVASPAPSTFMPLDEKRRLLQLSVRALHEAAPAPVDVVPLPMGAPFGTVKLDQAACTLCLACVSACPAGALSDNPERPMLRFTESLCVQCGLCEATCPEDAITIAAQVDFAAWNEPRRVLKEEEPFHCIACAKPFGTKSTIERIKARLEEKHWMFSGANRSRIEVLMMCDDCRVQRVVNEGFDPHAAPERPRVRTAEDFLREREEGKDGLN
ncbi:MAG: 4Fe-4S binding protein [Alsobacter sp.]